jgi:hypothetical protein
VADAITVVNQDIWLYVVIRIYIGYLLTGFSALAQVQLVQVQFQVLAVVLAVLEVDSVVDSLLVADLQADLVQQLAISAVDQTTSPEIARLKQ